MKRTFALLLTLFCASFTAAAADEVPAGFTPLFNGRDLTGWLERGPKGQTHWRVEAGELAGDGTNLTTDADYGDFELRLEYKAEPQATGGIHLRGMPRVAIGDTANGSGALTANHPGAPGRTPAQKADRPAGEWNKLAITMVGERVTVVLNGATVVDHCVLENAFASDEPPASSPRPNGFMRDPVPAKGPIQLATQTGTIRWRRINIRPIAPAEADALLAGRDADGFVRLDNGTDLTDWQGARDNYEVQDGCIVCKPGKGGTLLSKEEYGDMRLRFEFKLPLAGNNGIAIRTPPGGGPASDGFEIQVLDSDGYNAAHPKNPLLPYQYHGSLYFCAGAKHGYLRPVGTWNYEEIEVRGQKIKVTLNGTRILDVDLDTFDRSQIQHPPKGLDRRTGHIGFAGHNDPVAFRNFRVKRL